MSDISYLSILSQLDLAVNMLFFVLIGIFRLNFRSGNRHWEKVGLVLLSSLLTGITVACVDVAADHIPSATLTALRLSAASVAFCAILFFQRPEYRWHLRGTTDIAIIGVLNIGLPFLSLAMAVAYISSSLAVVPS